MSDTVKHVPEQSRFEIFDGGELAGFAAYRDHEAQRIFHHTEIGEQFGGKGLATKLIGEALSQTSGAGLRIVPVCEFVQKFLDKHDEFAADVDEVTPEVLDLLG
ncbi:GNAT family N-acetyltransferase [Mycobacterium sp. NPDC003323]